MTARDAAAREAAAREAAAREAATLEAEALEAARHEAQRPQEAEPSQAQPSKAQSSQELQKSQDAASPSPASPDDAASPDAEPGHTVDELTDDLRRLAAEYANYRKRVERGQVAAAERVRAGVLATLLPVLDDMDAAEEHGELVGVLRAVAGKLRAAVAGLGVSSFGEDGDRFDAAIHEAVEYEYVTGASGSAPSVAGVLRRGYRLGDQVLRPALVAVAEPAPESGLESEPEAEPGSASETEPGPARGSRPADPDEG